MKQKSLNIRLGQTPRISPAFSIKEIFAGFARDCRKKNAEPRASEISPALQYRTIHNCQCNGGIYRRVHKSILFRWESRRDIV